MSLSVSLRRSARAEFIEAAARYESERQDLGVEFIAEIERCICTAAVGGQLRSVTVPKCLPETRRSRADEAC
jgi:hypothetical protein